MDGKNERNDKTEMNKWRLRKERKGGEINGGVGGGVNDGKCVCYAPLSLSLSLSVCLSLSHSDMSI